MKKGEVFFKYRLVEYFKEGKLSNSFSLVKTKELCLGIFIQYEVISD